MNAQAISKKMYRALLWMCLTITAVAGWKSSWAQDNTIYPTQMIRIDSGRIMLEKQQTNFVLGQDFPTVIIKDVYYHAQAKKYMVFGLIDDVNYNNNDTYKVEIVVLNGDREVYSTTSSRNGVFAVALGQNERIRFIGELSIVLSIRQQ